MVLARSEDPLILPSVGSSITCHVSMFLINVCEPSSPPVSTRSCRSCRSWLKDVTSHRLKLWTRGKPPYDPGIPGYMSLDSPFLRSDVEEMLPELSHECKVIVYATALKALCAVRGLIDLGLTPSQIILVRPAPPTKRAMGGGENYRPVSGNSWSLGDATIDSSVAAIIAEIGITDAGEMKLEDIRRDEGGLLAASFTFSGGGGGHDEFTRIKQRQDKQQQQQQRLLQDQGKAKQRASSGEREEWEERGKRGKQGEGDCGRERSVMRQKKQRESCEDDRARDVVRIECGLLLCGDNPSADPDIFHAVNDSGLVYDGRLVVDSTFGTSDPFILAGGTLTKFSRACGTDMPRHELCNAREVRVPLMIQYVQTGWGKGVLRTRNRDFLNPFCADTDTDRHRDADIALDAYTVE